MTYTLHLGDCLDVMRGMAAGSVDAIVCDPPYGLGFMGKEWDSVAALASIPPSGKNGAGSPFTRTRTGKGPKAVAFDGPAFQAWCQTWAVEALRVLAPGGYLLAFGGSRTYHRMACAIEDAGFEIRDMIEWLYASGFPKSLNVNKQLDEQTCACSSSALPYDHAETEPATERDVRFVRPADVSASVNADRQCGQILFAGMSEQGSSQCGKAGAEPEPATREESGLEGRGNVLQDAWQLHGSEVRASASMGATNGAGGRLHHGTPDGDGSDVRPVIGANRSGESRRPPTVKQRARKSGTLAHERGPQTGGAWPVCGRCGKPILPKGLGTALKPAHEPIVVARKPLAESTVAANVLAYGTGALNIEDCRIGVESTIRHCNAGTGDIEQWRTGKRASVNGSAAGRWPANLALDEVAAEMVDQQSGVSKSTGGRSSLGAFRNGDIYGAGRDERWKADPGFGDVGGASRFFYVAKASRSERNAGLEGMPELPASARTNLADPSLSDLRMGHKQNRLPMANHHPTVKPIALMDWLIRLVTPPGGTVLDPFMGSGTTGIAALRGGFDFIGIEKEIDYYEISRRRLAHATAALDPPVRECSPEVLPVNDSGGKALQGSLWRASVSNGKG